MAAGGVGPRAFTASCSFALLSLAGGLGGEKASDRAAGCSWGVPWGRGARVEVRRVWGVGAVLPIAGGGRGSSCRHRIMCFCSAVVCKGFRRGKGFGSGCQLLLGSVMGPRCTCRRETGVRTRPSGNRRQRRGAWRRRQRRQRRPRYLALCVIEHEVRACGGGRLCRRRAQGPFEVNGQRRCALAKIKGSRGLIYTRQLVLNYTLCQPLLNRTLAVCVIPQRDHTWTNQGTAPPLSCPISTIETTQS